MNDYVIKIKVTQPERHYQLIISTMLDKKSYFYSSLWILVVCS